MAWASWKESKSAGSVQGRRWPAYAEHTVRKWVYLVDYPNLRVDNAYRVWMRERSAHLWVGDAVGRGGLGPSGAVAAKTPATYGQRRALPLSSSSCSART